MLFRSVMESLGGWAIRRRAAPRRISPLGGQRTTRSGGAWGHVTSIVFKVPAEAATFEVTCPHAPPLRVRSEEHTSELQSLMRISYAVFCLKKKTNKT